MTTTKTPRVFEFTTEFSLPIPAEAFTKPVFRRDSANDLPFKGWFDANAAAAKEGKTPATFVPFAYFVEARKIDADKVDGAYVKGKLRDQFNAWRDQKKVITTPMVREPHVMGVSKDGKPVIKKLGKVTTEEVSTNVERGDLMLVQIERTGKEKLEGIKEPGISMWLILTEEAKAARKATAEKGASNS